MICPRCGRPVSDGANFCGGCGLPRAEIERYARRQAAPGGENPPRGNTLAAPDDLYSRPDGLYGGDTGAETPAPEEPERQTGPEEPLTPPPVYYGDDGAPGGHSENLFNGGYTRGQSSYSYNAPRSPMYSQGPATPPPEYRKPAARGEILTPADYILMMLLMSIPVVGLVYLFHTAFVQTGSPNRRAFARAQLIMAAFTLALATVFFIGLMLSM